MTDSADIRPPAPEEQADSPLPDIERGYAAPPTPGMTRSGKVRSTRMSAWWVGLILAAILLVLLLIFIAQNSRDVTVHYLGLHGQVSLAIALLLSAVAGILVIAIPGTARIVQLRRALKRNAGSHAAGPAAAAKRS